MSFYGNVFYELTNAFASFLLKNTNWNNENFLESVPDNTEISAVGLGGSFNLDSGNRWIRLAGDKESKTAYIHHAKPDPSNRSNSANSFVKVLRENENQATQLNPGDCFQAANVYYDEAGHITSSDLIYYQLPISDTERDIGDLQEKMSELEDSNETQNAKLDSHDVQFISVNTDIASLHQYDEDLSKSLDDLSDFVGSKEDLTFKNKTITQSIGNVDALQESYGFNSVTDGIGNLSTRLNAQSATINNNALATKVAITNLCNALAEHDIYIDVNSLWKES